MALLRIEEVKAIEKDTVHRIKDSQFRGDVDAKLEQHRYLEAYDKVQEWIDMLYRLKDLIQEQKVMYDQVHKDDGDPYM